MVDSLGPPEQRKLEAHRALKHIRQDWSQDLNDLLAKLDTLWSELGNAYSEEQRNPTDIKGSYAANKVRGRDVEGKIVYYNCGEPRHISRNYKSAKKFKKILQTPITDVYALKVSTVMGWDPSDEEEDWEGLEKPKNAQVSPDQAKLS
ncbi:uncharacterized protein yc1106_07645 [Curvularia clavata]|uniref:Uncharacterized protein n=1 Tax=Curvularia clavata TaxID=95742 RepID=A0A9Q8ZDZ4_CURCL|nr:uncharacterized protein yc1106_07645 [Curvularia clavata]